MLTILGRRLFLTARVKKRCAARRSRLAVSKKSTVFPCLSTARYQYRSSPRILMYVSSSLQLLPTGRADPRGDRTLLPPQRYRFGPHCEASRRSQPTRLCSATDNGPLLGRVFGEPHDDPSRSSADVT